MAPLIRSLFNPRTIAHLSCYDTGALISNAQLALHVSMLVHKRIRAHAYKLCAGPRRETTAYFSDDEIGRDRTTSITVREAAYYNFSCGAEGEAKTLRQKDRFLTKPWKDACLLGHGVTEEAI